MWATVVSALLSRAQSVTESEAAELEAAAEAERQRQIVMFAALGVLGLVVVFSMTSDR